MHNILNFFNKPKKIENVFDLFDNKTIMGGLSDEVVYTEQRIVPSFNKIHVEGVIHVIITKGEKSVEVKTTKTILPLIITKVVDDELLIFIKPNSSYQGKVEVYVSIDSLNGLVASGNSSIKTHGDRFETDVITLESSGNSDISFSVICKTFNVTLSGNSDISFNLLSETVELNIDCGGNSKFNGNRLESKHCKVNTSGNSETEVNVSETLDIDLSGISTLKYYGNPDIIGLSTSGISKVKKLKHK